MLESGASLDYTINRKNIDSDLIRKDKAINEIQLKHQRWRKLRLFLKLEEQIGNGTTQA